MVLFNDHWLIIWCIKLTRQFLDSAGACSTTKYNSEVSNMNIKKLNDKTQSLCIRIDFLKLNVGKTATDQEINGNF